MIVRRSLAPLDRVAATATPGRRAAARPGEVALAERVPAADTDPRTEVGQVGAALNAMLDHVESALHARQESEKQVRQFVADASHELRTPLASIRGYAELTRREPEPVPPTVTHALGRVESEALRMPALVEDLLLLARLDAGRPLEREPVDLSLLGSTRSATPTPPRPTTPGSSTCPTSRSRSPATRPGCTRWSPTCSPTPAPTPRPAPGS